MIRFGLAGIPLTSKGRTFVESVEDTHNLGLNALEVQLLRVNVQETPAVEYAGQSPVDVENSIIVDILRQDSDGNYRGIGIDSVIEESDIVQEIFWNMARNYDELREGGELARELDVSLSMHAPYYMDLLQDDEMGEKSYNHLKWTLIIGKAMKCKRVVTHTGFYLSNKKDSLRKAIEVYSSFSSAYGHDSGFPYIGVETSGKTEIFGSVPEVIGVAKKVSNVEPILNFPHVHSVTGGSLIEVKDFDAIISEFSKYAKGDLYTEFAGVEYEDHNEKKLTAIKHGDLKFETLAESLIEFSNDSTIISCSPLLEHDAQYMNIIYLRTISRKFQKRSTVKKTVA
ncbi:MAG: TIM barrel protein [Thermoplasmataceae archaeon]